MAWYGTNRNAGIKAYRPAFADPEDVKYAVDYSHNAQRYVSETEQVIQFRGVPAIPEYYDNHYGPRKILELHKGAHGVRDEPSLLASWNPFGRDQRPNKGDELSPKARGQGGHRPWSPDRDHEPPKKGNKFSPKAHDQVGRRPWSPDHYHEPPKKGNKFSPKAHDQVGRRPWSPDHGPKKGNEFSGGPVGHGPNKSNMHRDSSPPSRDHYYRPHDDNGKYKNLRDDTYYGHDSDDDDVVCEDGVCYKKGSRDQKPNNNPLRGQDYNRDKEKHKLGNSYSPPPYTAPKKDPYYEKTYPKDNDRGNGYIPSYTVPVTSPRKDAYYEPSNNGTHPHQPPITRIDTNKAVDFLKESPRNSPRSVAGHQQQYGSPRKDQGHQETIDSGEARRRYGTASPAPQGGAYGEEKYKGTIDSITAAKKYNGVFVPKG